MNRGRGEKRSGGREEDQIGEKSREGERRGGERRGEE